MIGRLALTIYSLWFWLVGFLWMGLVVLPAVAVQRVLWPRAQHQYAWANVPMGVTPRLNFIRYRVVRDAAYDPDRPSVYAQNHVNLLDAHTACAALPRTFCGLMNAWQFYVPIYGWVMWLTHGIAVSPSPLERARELPRVFRQRAEMGLSILTFPEGHRTPDGEVHEFKRGVIQLARNAGLPVVPVAVRGMYRHMQKGSWLVRPFGVVQVWIGPQFETTGLRSAKDTGDLAKTLENLVREFVRTGVPPQVETDMAGAPRHVVTDAGERTTVSQST